MNTPIDRGHRHVGSAAIVLLIVLAACSSAASSVAPSPPASGSPGSPLPSVAPQATSITTPEAAASIVLASDPRFAGIGPQDPNAIGQCCSWLVTPAGDGFAVTIEVGWGDCPAGCINRHHWFFTVTRSGSIHLDREDGLPVPAGVPGSSGGPSGGPSGGTTGGVVGIRGIAMAGPVCPVVRPNDPACADRPVPGVTVHVIDATGTEVATVQTDATGTFTIALPAGRYHLVPDPVQGLMRTASAADVTVGAGLTTVQLSYDTGIR